jgi:hypothetical protein
MKRDFLASKAAYPSLGIALFENSPQMAEL